MADDSGIAATALAVRPACGRRDTPARTQPTRTTCRNSWGRSREAVTHGWRTCAHSPTWTRAGDEHVPRAVAPARSPTSRAATAASATTRPSCPADIADGRTMAELAPDREARDQSPRPRGTARCSTGSRNAVRRLAMIVREESRGCAVDRFEHAADRAQARGRPGHGARSRSSPRPRIRPSTSSRRSSRSSRCARPSSPPTSRTRTATRRSRTSRPRSRRC